MGVHVEGRGALDVRLGGAKQQGVLALLALATPRAVPTDQLIDGLWGDEPPATARNAIQVYLTGLRKALRSLGFSIDRVGDSYVLRGDVMVDAARFDEAVAAGRAALRTGRADRSAEALTDALGLWGGRPLDGLDALPFTSGARATLEALRASARIDLAEAQLRLGRHDDALRTAQVVLDERPYDEVAWSAVVRASYHAGRQDDALAACRRVRRLLAEDLGVDPTPALVELEAQVRHQTVPAPPPVSPVGDSATDAEADEPALPPLPSLPRPFVGRGELVDQVTALVTDGTRVVTLTGLGGMGKTTLALAVAHRLRESGTRIAFCPLEADVTAAAALTRACRAVSVEPEDDAVVALGTGFDGVLLLDNAEQVIGLPAEVDRLVTQHSGPVLLVTSRRPLGCPGERILAVPGLDVSTADGEDAPDAVTLFLGIAERVGADLGQRVSNRHVVDLCTLLDGIPLAIELTASRTRTVPPSQLLDRLRKGKDSALDGPHGAARARQASLGVVLEDTLGSLSSSASRLLGVLAAFEGLVTLDLLESAAADLVESDVLRTLEELVDCGLAVPANDGRVRLRAPVREFVRGDGPNAEFDAAVVRGVCHLAAAHGPRLAESGMGEALARLTLDEDAIATAVTHAVGSGDVTSAVALVRSLPRYWLLASRIPEGGEVIDRVTAMQDLDPSDRGWLELLAGTYASYLHGPEAATMLATALGEAARLGLPPDRVHVNGWCALAALRAQSGEHDEAQAHHASAAELAARSGDAALVLLVRDLEAFLASHAGDCERSLDIALRALEEAHAAGSDYDLAHLYNSAADNLNMLGRPDEALAMVDEGLDRVAEGNIGLTAQLLLMRGISLTLLGRVPEAHGVLTEFLLTSRERFPDRMLVADALFAIGAGSAMGGRDEVAARCFASASSLYEENGVTAQGRLPAGLLAEVAPCTDRLGPARHRTFATLGHADPDRMVSSLLG